MPIYRVSVTEKTAAKMLRKPCKQMAISRSDRMANLLFINLHGQFQCIG